MKKVIVGLGCSWTQGEGGYPQQVWDHYKGRVNLPMHLSKHLIPYELQNSWVNVLTTKYFKDYSPINLGQRGIGNRGSARSLYLANLDWNDVEDGIVIFMMSGLERFDFFRDSWMNPDICGISGVKNCGHYNFQTLWPHIGNSKHWDLYAEHIYSEDGTAAETLCNILEVQTFCKAHNLKFIFCNAFDGRGQGFLYEHCKSYADKINWDCYIHTYRNYESFVNLLVLKDQILNEENWRDYWGVYRSMEAPQKYLTNCIHPTIKGYEVIAEELAKFIEEKYEIAANRS